jgi:hypothetical protein
MVFPSDPDRPRTQPDLDKDWCGFAECTNGVLEKSWKSWKSWDSILFFWNIRGTVDRLDGLRRPD